MAIPVFPSNEGRSLRVTFLFLVCYAAKNAVMYCFLGAAADLSLFLLHFIPLLLFTCLLFTTMMVKNRCIFISVYVGNIFYLLANIAYFYHFNDLMHINLYYTLLSEGADVVRTGSFVFKRFFLIGLIDLPAVCYIIVRFQTVRKFTAAYISRRSVVVGLLVFIATHAGIYLYFKNSGNFIFSVASNHAFALRHGLALQNAVDLLELNKTAHHSIRKIPYGEKYSVSAGSKPLANILMLQVESLDANIINYLHDGRPVTPFLNALQKESIYYPFTLSYRSVGGTSDCELTVLNSIEPFGAKPNMLSATYFYPNAVTKQLSPDDFDIAAFHGNVNSFYGRGKAYHLMGFRQFFDINAMHLKASGWGAPDSDVLNFVQNSIADRKKHFFYYVITMSSHEPFTTPRNYYNDGRFDNIPDKLARDYLNAIAYTDKQLQSFVAAVKQQAPDTYIFIYGDHTPFLINEGPFRRAALTYDNRDFEFVPLFIITPDHKKYVEKKRIASYLDLAPTLLSASGASGSIGANGVNLLRYPLIENNVLFRRHVYSRRDLFIKALKTAQ